MATKKKSNRKKIAYKHLTYKNILDDWDADSEGSVKEYLNLSVIHLFGDLISHTEKNLTKSQSKNLLCFLKSLPKPLVVVFWRDCLKKNEIAKDWYDKTPGATDFILDCLESKVG